MGFLLGISCPFHEGFPSTVNMQPKFFVESAADSTMDREHSRQVEHDKLVQAGVALGFWQDHENLFM